MRAVHGNISSVIDFSSTCLLSCSGHSDQFVSDDRLSDEIHTNGYTLTNKHIHTNTHLTNAYMQTSVMQPKPTHTLIHTHEEAHTLKDAPHLHTPTLTPSICLACLFPMLTLQHSISAASIFRSCSHVELSGPIIRDQSFLFLPFPFFIYFSTLGLRWPPGLRNCGTQLQLESPCQGGCGSFARASQVDSRWPPSY